MKKIALLGSTGSIGRQVLEIVDRYPEKYKIVSMSAGSNASLFEAQLNKYKPSIATFSCAEKVHEIKEVPTETTLYYGENSLIHAVTPECDVVFDAVMGYAGLNAVKHAIALKKPVALANKETLVAGGGLIMPMASNAGVDIIPVDSEHSAIWQSLEFGKRKDFKKIIITASGGAFRNTPINDLNSVTAEDALKHPNWQMGAKITIDCATMVNKGFEVIEAMWLFSAKRSDIEVVIHPESVIHSMVEYSDGAVISQMGTPSMLVPISLALSYPERLETGAKPLSFKNTSLTFKELDLNRYPCFALCDKAISLGGVYPCAFSAADEEAVKLFLQNKITYPDIYRLIESALEKNQNAPLSFESLELTDKLARATVLDEYRRIKC
ncbi:MAG: 1-deoxy-D-xylulose-5-phosphate reductoisomerase [Clostridia bacterium]|nr:1-deoxy-D-xylulose-5-phosphate reductoisomerase [Clostridia bacterium]